MEQDPLTPVVLLGADEQHPKLYLSSVAADWEEDGCRSPKMVAFWEYYCITRNCMILGIIIR